jgi:PKD repeat protein
VGITATPDSITQDGGSQSNIQVVVHDANGRPASNVGIRLDMMVNGSETDYGTLSARNLVTGTDGTALAVYTAPPAPPAGSTVPTCSTVNTVAVIGPCVTILATPLGNNFSASNAQSVLIRLTPIGVILPPGEVPVASFVVTPTPVNVSQTAIFDGSGSCAAPLSGGACNPSGVVPPTIAQYSWSFGDGTTAVGKTATHTYTQAGTFTATLAVTNNSNLTASASQTIAVLPGTPTAALSLTKAGGNSIVADGTASTAVAGSTISDYTFTYVDPGHSGSTRQSGTSTTDQITFSAAGTYTVTLTVTDSDSRTATTSASVTVP